MHSALEDNEGISPLIKDTFEGSKIIALCRKILSEMKGVRREIKMIKKSRISNGWFSKYITRRRIRWLFKQK